MKYLASMMILLVEALLLSTAHAAARTNESFAAGANGWNGSSLGSGSWDFGAGDAELSFISFPFFPDRGVLSNSPSATGGAFTGNFVSADVDIMGCRVLAEDVLPSSVALQWAGSTSIYNRVFFLDQTGIWMTVAASMESVALGDWTVLEGSADDFNAAKADVEYVFVRITRSSMDAQVYRVDDIFLGPLHAGSTFDRDGNIASLSWNEALTGVTYRVETTTNLVDTGWSTARTLTATGTTFTTVFTNEESEVYYRLMLE